jgi:hypothetical protein
MNADWKTEKLSALTIIKGQFEVYRLEGQTQASSVFLVVA